MCDQNLRTLEQITYTKLEKSKSYFKKELHQQLQQSRKQQGTYTATKRKVKYNSVKKGWSIALHRCFEASTHRLTPVEVVKLI